MVAAHVCVVLGLAAVAAAHRGRQAMIRGALPQINHARLGTIPMRLYAEDCWKRRAVHMSLSEQGSHVETALPGAGMEPGSSQPFQMVLKDGFFAVACAKDYLLQHGDKFGDGKYSYTLGDVSNVSIVHYTSLVTKEDREDMTPEVCFKFCRTVPDMLTFGIHNGRDCYCAPYFKPMESDSTNCDAVCPGNPTLMCGGKVKSSIFEMHMCSDTGAQLTETSGKASSMMAVLGSSIQDVEGLAEGMQASATTLQATLGAVGDPAATGLMQEAKVFGGKLMEAVNASKEIKKAISDATTEAAGMSGLSGLDPIAKAEALTAKLEKLTADAEDAAEDLDSRAAATSPSGRAFNVSIGAEEQYYPMMYFVDKAFKGVPSTCTGSLVANPMTLLNETGCAQACDAEVQSCVGFSFFDSVNSLCFLFSKIEEVTYYTGCNKTGTTMACMAKLSKFDGTSVKPDPSGKCDGCLEKATEAARCP